MQSPGILSKLSDNIFVDSPKVGQSILRCFLEDKVSYRRDQMTIVKVHVLIFNWPSFRPQYTVYTVYYEVYTRTLNAEASVLNHISDLHMMLVIGVGWQYTELDLSG